MPFAWAFVVALLSGCTLPAVDAGHEGVLVAQPILFGHGGVDPVPVPTGRVSTALTTDLIQVDVRPRQYAEHFGIISSENASLAFDAFLIVRVRPGRSPELIQRFGPNWYASNVKEAFRTLSVKKSNAIRYFNSPRIPAPARNCRMRWPRRSKPRSSTSRPYPLNCCAS